MRIDLIEQAIREAGVLTGGVGASGYDVANALALSNLQLGHTVVADCVNPVKESREAWKAIAVAAKVALLDVRVICSDQQEHQRRVETRTGDIPGLVPPTWASVLAHEYEAWDEVPLTLDTAFMTPEQAVTTTMATLNPVASGLAPRWGAKRP